MFIFCKDIQTGVKQCPLIIILGVQIIIFVIIRGLVVWEIGGLVVWRIGGLVVWGEWASSLRNRNVGPVRPIRLVRLQEGARFCTNHTVNSSFLVYLCLRVKKDITNNKD